MSKTAIPEATRGSYFNLDPSLCTIVLDKDSPLYDKRALLEPDAGLMASLAEFGNIEPIVVRKNGDTYEVVVGRRRVKAALEINKTRAAGGIESPILLKALTVRGTDADLSLMVIAENSNRKDDPPSLQAEKIQRSINFGATAKQLSKAMGVTEQTVNARVRLLDCHASVQKAVDAGVIGETSARKLSALPRDQQKEELERMVEAGEVRGLKAKKAVEKAVNGHSKETGARLRSRAFLNKWLDELASNEGDSVGLVVGAIRYALGDDDALGGKYRAYKPKFAEAEE